MKKSQARKEMKKVNKTLFSYPKRKNDFPISETFRLSTPKQKLNKILDSNHFCSKRFKEFKCKPKKEKEYLFNTFQFNLKSREKAKIPFKKYKKSYLGTLNQKSKFRKSKLENQKYFCVKTSRQIKRKNMEHENSKIRK